MHIVLLHFYSDTPTPAYQEIALALRGMGHTVWVGTRNRVGNLTWHDGQRLFEETPGPAQPPDRLVQVPLVGSVLERYEFLRFIQRVRRLLQEYSPDIVQVNHASVRWLGVLPLFMPAKMRFVLDFRQVGQRGATDPVGRLKGAASDWWRRICSRYIYDRACFLHPAGAKVILGKSWPKWGSVVPLGVSQRFLSLEHADNGLRDEERLVRFLYVGTLSRVRHLEQILFAVRELVAVGSQFRVVFMGTDSADSYYQNLVGELDLGALVSVKAPVPYEEVPNVIADFDVALAYVPERPAHWQYHPTMKVLEYRALGMPIIASDNEPNREVVEPGVNGLLVQNSVSDLAEGMKRFMIDPGFLDRCTENARRMRRGRTWSEVAKMYEEDVYEKLASGDAPQLDRVIVH
jgi:glycosyltransferase involved in cell wall biosynthesis